MSGDIASSVQSRPLESAHFGVPIFGAQADSVQSVLEACAHVSGTPGALLVLRVPCASMDAAQAAEFRGGRICDVLLTLTRATAATETGQPKFGNVPCIAAAEPKDQDELVQLAGVAFSSFVGHWHTDRRIDRRLADRLYQRWASDLVRESSPTSPVLISRDEHNGEIIGFLALRRASEAHFDVPLTAVHPLAKARGIFTALLRHAVSFADVSGATRFDYETQIQNVGAVRAVSRLGFAPESARFTFHIWSDER